MTPVETCPMSRLMSTTAINIRFIGSRSWTAATFNAEGGSSAATLFGP